MAPKRTVRPQAAEVEVDERQVEAEFIAAATTGKGFTPRTQPSTMAPASFTQAKVLEPMTDELTDVRAFARRIGLLVHTDITHLTANHMLEQFAVLHPLIEELWEGMETHNMALIAQALVQVVYQVKLIAVSMGLPWEALWEEVHLANMEKVPSSAVAGQRVSAVTQPGWAAPAIPAILEQHGYRHHQWFDRQGGAQVEKFADYGQAPLHDAPKAHTARRR